MNLLLSESRLPGDTACMKNFYVEAEKAEECFPPLYNFQYLALVKSVDEINGLMSADGQNTLKCRYILEVLSLDFMCSQVN